MEDTSCIRGSTGACQFHAQKRIRLLSAWTTYLAWCPGVLGYPFRPPGPRGNSRLGGGKCLSKYKAQEGWRPKPNHWLLCSLAT